MTSAIFNALLPLEQFFEGSFAMQFQILLIYESFWCSQVRQNALGSGVLDSDDASGFDRDIALDQAEHVPDPVHPAASRWNRVNSVSEVATIISANAANGGGGGGGGRGMPDAISYVGVYNSEGTEVSMGSYCAKQVLPTIDGGA